MTGFVRTVLGDIPADELGRTDYHEHLFQVSPLLPRDELDDETLSRREAELFAASGFEAMVDATPLGLGRDAAAIARISATAGVRVVMSTGAHRPAHYGDGHPLLEATVDDLADRFAADLLDGADGTGVRAGHLKTGIDYWSITPFSRRVLEAAAITHERTGVPVMVHLEHGSATHQVLDLLESLGVGAHRVALAHADRNPDPGLHAELAARGAYLGYDGAARHKDHPESVLLDCLFRVIELGHGDRVLLGGDVARRSRYAAYGGMPGLAYLGERFVPRVVGTIGADATDRILRVNPAAYLTWGA